jgi:hypothetical protein
MSHIIAFKISARVVPHNSEKHQGLYLDHPGYHAALTAHEEKCVQNLHKIRNAYNVL